MMRDLGFSPDPWQLDLARSPLANSLLCCSRQSGKTTTVACRALHEGLFGDPKKARDILIFAPAGRQTKEFLDRMMLFYNRLGQPVPRETDRMMELDFANGSRVIPLPNNEEAIRGYTARLVIFDEAARVPDALFHAVTPMLATTEGKILALSTPFGKQGWFYQEWTEGVGWKRVKVTADDCPRIPKEFLDSERRKKGTVWFNQEYYCDFSQAEGLVFPGLASCVVDPQPVCCAGRRDAADGGLHATTTAPHAYPAGSLVGVRCFAGVDWGWHNPAAILVGVLDKDDVLWIVEEVYGGGMTMDGRNGDAKHDASDLVAHAQACAKQYPIEMWLCDPAEPRNIERFRRADLPAREGLNRIQPGVLAVNGRINTGRLKVFSTCKNLIHEAGLYRYPTPEERKVVGENPIDADNHACAALRYMIASIDRTSEVKGRQTIAREISPIDDELETVESRKTGGVLTLKNPTPGERVPAREAWYEEDRGWESV